MLILNLGCGGPGLLSWHPVEGEGVINRDPNLDGWHFEDGLGEFADNSVDGISVSHAAMYVRIEYWPAMFAEFARVLRDGGVIRITEDATDDTRSRTFPRGWHDAVTLTSSRLVKEHMLAAGLVPHDCDAYHSTFESDILMQRFHGEAPHCFWVEGRRETRVLLSPHSDDECLFASGLILRYRPRVIICNGSAGDYGTTEERFAETREAMTVLGGHSCEQWNGGDLVAQMRELDARVKPSLVFACNRQTSHPDHVAVAIAAEEVFGKRLRTYHTYDASGKVTSAWPVLFEPEWAHQKLRALTRYRTQATHARACEFFLRDQHEFMGEP